MKAKKSLGQHFLKSQKAISSMVSAAGAQKADFILEIGPGTGILTKALLQTGAKVIAVEKDPSFIPILSKNFKKEIATGQLKIIHEDILKYDMPKMPFDTYKLVANIPYYITGQIIRMFLEKDIQPQSMTLLVQKEVAERIVAKDKKESLLSLSVKAYGEPKYIEKVPRGAFAPSPNVDSAIVHIANISKKIFPFDLIHAGFAHKRKQLLPNLSNLYKRGRVMQALTKLEIPPTSRAEDIPIEKWVGLSKLLK
jgi:16S rRNA (adenine1518-N6/adenine1519-N6)-dimethyltransferase